MRSNPDHTALVQILRYGPNFNDRIEAASLITQQAARIAELEAMLKDTDENYLPAAIG